MVRELVNFSFKVSENDEARSGCTNTVWPTFRFFLAGWQPWRLDSTLKSILKCNFWRESYRFRYRLFLNRSCATLTLLRFWERCSLLIKNDENMIDFLLYSWCIYFVTHNLFHSWSTVGCGPAARPPPSFCSLTLAYKWEWDLLCGHKTSLNRNRKMLFIF